MSWFKQVFGFKEKDSYMKTQAQFEFNRERGELKSKRSKRTFICGRYVTPSLAELREAGLPNVEAAIEQLSKDKKTRIHIKEVIGDVSLFHIDKENYGALFQAASQFNTLEHGNDSGTPEQGIADYSDDRTQGSCCAIACAPGTIVRNYFAHEALGDWSPDKEGLTRGMTAKHQVQNLRDINELLDNLDARYYEVRNGYTLATSENLENMQKKIDEGGTEFHDEIRKRLRIGLQEDTEVVCSGFGADMYTGTQQLVTQAYCSAISVSYSGQFHTPEKWMPFAKLILEAAYEATLYAAVENYLRHPEKPGANKVFLTALGGGVFGNDMSWIYDAMERSFQKFAKVGLEVSLVSYDRSTQIFAELERMFGENGNFFEKSGLQNDPCSEPDGSSAFGTLPPTGMAKIHPEELDQVQKMKKDFSMLDTRGDGAVQLSEVRRVLSMIDSEMWTDEVVDDLFKAMSLNKKDSLIQIDELLHWVFARESRAHVNK